MGCKNGAIDLPEYHRQAPFHIFLGSTFRAFRTSATCRVIESVYVMRRQFYREDRYILHEDGPQ